MQSPLFTPKQGQYLAFIYAYTQVLGRPPAEADIQRHFKVTAPTVHQMVITLERTGLIRTSRCDGMLEGTRFNGQSACLHAGSAASRSRCSRRLHLRSELLYVFAVTEHSTALSIREFTDDADALQMGERFVHGGRREPCGLDQRGCGRDGLAL